MRLARFRRRPGRGSTRGRGGLVIPPSSLFSESALTQDADGGVVIDGNTEAVNFGDTGEGWNGLTAFTYVLRWQPSNTGAQENMAGREDVTASERQFSLFHRNPGTSFAAVLSPNGTAAFFVWRENTLSTANDYIFAVGYDGSDSGGQNQQNRIKLFRLQGPEASWEELTWDFDFGNGTSEVPDQLSSITGVEEWFGSRQDENADGVEGTLRLLAVRYGKRFTAAELDAMDFYGENLEAGDWDRAYYFNGNLADQFGGVHGSFRDLTP